MHKKFNIGDVVWTGGYDQHAQQITCPDCCGNKVVHVILGNDVIVEIDCPGCQVGGYPSYPTGQVTSYEFHAHADKHVITSIIEKSGGEYEYGINSFSPSSWNTLFATEEEAIAHSESERSEYESEANQRARARTKKYQSWANNASYHLKGAESDRRSMEYHLAAARICESRIKVKP